jgi:hypothetical protein
MNCWAIFAPPLYGAKKMQNTPSLNGTKKVHHLGDDKIESPGAFRLASFLTDHF